MRRTKQAPVIGSVHGSTTLFRRQLKFYYLADQQPGVGLPISGNQQHELAIGRTASLRLRASSATNRASPTTPNAIRRYPTVAAVLPRRIWDGYKAPRCRRADITNHRHWPAQTTAPGTCSGAYSRDPRCRPDIVYRCWPCVGWRVDSRKPSWRGPRPPDRWVWLSALAVSVFRHDNYRRQVMRPATDRRSPFMMYVTYAAVWQATDLVATLTRRVCRGWKSAASTATT